MKLYVYNTETRQVVEVVEAPTNAECEAIASEKYDTDTFGWTYTPAFGANDGLKA